MHRSGQTEARAQLFIPCPFPSQRFRHTVGRDIGNLINPFMRVTAEMTRYLVTSRESQLLPPLTPRMWEISSPGQSKEWEDKELCCVCDGVWWCALCGGVRVGHGRLWPNRHWPAVGCDRLWPDRLWPEFVQTLTPNPENLHTEP